MDENKEKREDFEDKEEDSEAKKDDFDKDKIMKESEINKEAEKSEEPKKEKIEEKESKETNSEEERRMNNQLKWILIVLGIFIVGLVIFSLMGTEKASFEYLGLDWNRKDVGEIPMYSVKIVGNSINGQPINFEMLFRNNPKEMDVAVEDELNLMPKEKFYLSLDLESNINECGVLGLVNFGMFMANMGFDLDSAVMSEEKSKELNRPYVTCENKPESTVFLLKKGNESRIYQDENNPNCYHLEVSGCKSDEGVEVLEKLQLAILSKYTGKPL